MFLYLVNTIAPVFLVIASGYLAVEKKLFVGSMIDGLMKFAVLVAIPCLLFQATSSMDLEATFDWQILVSYLTVSSFNFFLVLIVCWKLFGRRAGESVAISFAALFSNLVLIGLPISERAWGADNISPAYAIVSIHAPFCYLLGITVMEILRADGRTAGETARVVVTAMFRNSLMIGLGLGFIVNLSGIAVPAVILEAVDMLARASLPAALFALGGILTRYSLSQSRREVMTVSLVTLLLQPSLTWALCLLFGLEQQTLQVIVLFSAMAPGINAYLFANMYGRAQDVAASTVLFATVTSVFSISFWLALLQL